MSRFSSWNKARRGRSLRRRSASAVTRRRAVPRLELLEDRTLPHFSTTLIAGNVTDSIDNFDLAGTTPDASLLTPVSHDDPLAMHIHAHLSIVIDGQEQPIPAGIGIGPEGALPVHTHDATGLIHVESTEAREFQLQDFFAVWGQPFSSQEILRHHADAHTITMTVNGQPSSAFESLVLRDGDEIVVRADTLVTDHDHDMTLDGDALVNVAFTPPPSSPSSDGSPDGAPLAASPDVFIAAPPVERCNVFISDQSAYKPTSGLVSTKNVGQEIMLSAGVLLFEQGDVTNISWMVEGEVIDDYNEMEQMSVPESIVVTDHMESGGDPPIATFSGDKITFFWREMGQSLGARTVTARATVLFLDGPDFCQSSTTFTIERNTTDPNRQAEDYYTTNHSNGDFLSGVPLGRVLGEHRDWHRRNDKLLLVAGDYPGEEFFEFHKRYISRYNSWRTEFGYPVVGEYDPAVTIPMTEGGYNIFDASRTSSSPARPKPSYFTEAGGALVRPAMDNGCEPLGGQTKLADFDGFPMDLRALGCAVVQPWHNRVHGRIGGNMNDPARAPRDPVFWRWHTFVDKIYNGSWVSVRSQLSGVPPEFASALPARGYGVDVLNRVHVWFDQPVTGVSASDLRVNGFFATNVQGAGRGPYVFTGFLAPGPGPVTVELFPGNIRDAENLPFAGIAWNYTVVPFTDADGDGVGEGQSWPRPSFDNCPTVFNPNQADSDDDDLGDVCDPRDDHLLVAVAILDNGEWLYRERGIWQTVAGGWFGSYRVQMPGTGSRTATWTLQVTPGQYELFAIWVADPANATNAPYVIFDGGANRGTVRRNQQLVPDDGRFDHQAWESLGVYQINTGVVTVLLNDAANGKVIADGIIVVPVGGSLQVAPPPVNPEESAARNPWPGPVLLNSRSSLPWLLHRVGTGQHEERKAATAVPVAEGWDLVNSGPATDSEATAGPWRRDPLQVLDALFSDTSGLLIDKPLDDLLGLWAWERRIPENRFV